SVPLSSGFRPHGQVAVNINGLILTFSLNKSGAGKNENAAVKLRAQHGSGHFTLRLSRTSLASTLAPIGLLDDAAAGQATVPVTLLVDGSVYHADRTVRYIGKPGKAIS